jgi:DNA repair exonuclease SbcCD nuclease subunit
MNRELLATTASPLRLLVCADVHIGRRSGGLPADLAEELTPAAAWERAVAYAISERVAALVVCGDLADEGNAYFEALAPLERAAAALAAAGISFVTVAGNHDWDVLGRLADSAAAGGVVVLGRGGRWQHLDLVGVDGARVRLFGWSFPQRRVTESPLASFPLGDLDAGLVSLGLLHADLNASGGGYCPVSRAALSAVPVDGWILGHQHQPTPAAALNGRPVVLYPGSLQGLDAGPSERGSHGPWLVEVGAAGVQVRLVPQAVVRYDDCVVDVEGVRCGGDVQVRLVQALRAAVASAQADSPGLRCALLRLRLVGRTTVPRPAIDEQLRELQQVSDLGTGVRVVLDGWSVRTLPPLDLAGLRLTPTPLGAAVRLWLELTGQAGTEAGAAAALAGLQERLASFAARGYGSLGPARPDLPQCRELMAVQAERLIEALYAQKERVDG